MPTANAPASQRNRSNSSTPRERKASAIRMPTVAEMAWPRRSGRGCAQPAQSLKFLNAERAEGKRDQDADCSRDGLA
ncbi:hypothetical protein V491_02285 [Pseudogymnoascus sp. VKM F-3775]|nr:hypothetical protein V491_02285 [Pseudogymnoascus sp. VKM F-3775]